MPRFDKKIIMLYQILIFLRNTGTSSTGWAARHSSMLLPPSGSMPRKCRIWTGSRPTSRLFRLCSAEKDSIFAPMKKISLTGIKPTGTPHLGNYLGAIRPALELSKTYDTVYFIADYHALTTAPFLSSVHLQVIISLNLPSPFVANSVSFFS